MKKMDNPLIVSLHDKISEICTNADLVFCWLPSHIGINGNEEADKAAKEALSLDVLPFKVSYSDFKPLINVFIQDVWQRSWCDPLNKPPSRTGGRIRRLPSCRVVKPTNGPACLP